MKDTHLLLLVAGVAAIDVAILIVWVAVDPIHVATVKLDDQVRTLGAHFVSHTICVNERG